jgi:HSP20 family molecular chaperone IbpA
MSQVGSSMSSFLDRLKQKKVLPTTPEDEKKEKAAAQVKAAPDTSGLSAEQLKVDILQSTDAIIIYAQLAGAGGNDYSVTIDGEGDTVTIRGSRTRPDGEHFEHKDLEGKEEKKYSKSVRGEIFIDKSFYLPR